MKYFFILFTVASLLSCATQKRAIKTVPTSNVTEKEKPFPQNWYGKWKGILNIYNYGGETQEIPMEIHCGATDSSHRHQFALIYRSDTSSYELVAIDAKKGHYQTDEKNTIFLDGFYFDGIFYTRFEVGDNLITSQIEKRNGK